MRTIRGIPRHLLCVVLLSVNAWGDPAELAQAALERTAHPVVYDGSYRSIDYPNGDVPAHVGVCSDVVVRAYRAIGVDLQQRVHEDMSASFDAYPNRWGLSRPDTNIDHRRVPNLETFFARHGRSLPMDRLARDHRPGDVVSWRLGNGLPHIGIVGPNRVPGSARYYVVHNIGAGPVEADVLLAYRPYGHYRYLPSR
ncbi:MAG: DUF1287 domain-containing protein [Pseudomonadota bacterium]